jgi:hypothetical protein
MANPNEKFEITIEVDAAKGNASIKSVNKSLEDLERQALASAKKAGKGVDGLTDSFKSVGQAVQNFAHDPLDAAQSGIDALLSRMGPVAIGFGAVVTGAIAAGAAIFTIAEEAVDAARQIQNMSYATGMAVEDIQALNRLGQERGLGDLSGTIEKLNIQLGKGGGGDFTEALLRMGIAIKKNVDAAYYIGELRTRYADLTAEIGQNAAAQKMAADLGKRLVGTVGPLVMSTEEGIIEAMRAIKESGAVMSGEQIKGFIELEDKIEKHGRTWLMLKNQIGLAAGEATTIFLDMVDKFNNINLTKFDEGKLTDSQRVQMNKAMGGGKNIESFLPDKFASVDASSMVSTPVNELDRRQRTIIEADLVATGTARELIPLKKTLNDLERQFTEEKGKLKGVADYDEKKIGSLSQQIAHTKTLLELETSLTEIRKEEMYSTASSRISPDVLKKQEGITQDMTKTAFPVGTMDSWVKKFYDELDQAQSQRADADNINLGTAKLVTSEKYKQLQVEQIQIGQIQAFTPQEKIMMEARKADVDYRLNAEKLSMEYKQAILALDKEEHDLLKDSTIGETPELKAAFDARRKQLSATNADDNELLQIKRDQEIHDKQIIRAQQDTRQFVKTAQEEQLAQLRAYYDEVQFLLDESVISEQEASDAKKRIAAEELSVKYSQAQTFFGTLAQMQNSHIRALAVVGKASAIAHATINTYVAATEALAYGGPIAGPIQMAAILAVGFAQVAQIASQGFKSGGYTGAMGVDQVAGVVHGREFVMNSDATKQYLPLLQMLNSGRSVGAQMDNGPSLNGWPKQSLNVTIANYGTSKQFEVEHLDEGTIRIIARDEAFGVLSRRGPEVIANDLTYANSKTSKAVARHTTARRGDR